MPVRLKTFLSSERISYFTTTAGLLRPHLAFFNPHSTHQLISAHTTSLQCCVVDPTAAKAELPPVPGGTPGWEVGTEGRDTFGHRRLLGSSCPEAAAAPLGSLAPVPSSSLCSQQLPSGGRASPGTGIFRSITWKTSQCMPRARSVPGVEAGHGAAELHATLTAVATRSLSLRRRVLPAARARSQLSRSGPSSAPPATVSGGKYRVSSRRYSPPVLNALGETRRAAVPAPGAGGPAPQSPQRMRTWGAAVPITVQPDLARGARVCGKQRASLLWGCSGRAAEEVLAVTECRGSEETDSRCFWTSLDVKSGLWEGGGRSEPGRMGSHCLLGHPDFLQTLSKNPPAQSPAQVMLNSHKAREASGCGMLYQGSTRMRLGKHAREPHGSKLTPGIRILTEQ